MKYNAYLPAPNGETTVFRVVRRAKLTHPPGNLRIPVPHCHGADHPVHGVHDFATIWAFAFDRAFRQFSEIFISPLRLDVSRYTIDLVATSFSDELFRYQLPVAIR